MFEIAQIREPLTHIYGESCRKGLFGLLIVVETNGPLRGNGHTGTETEELVLAVNMNVAEACVVSHIHVQGGHDGDEQAKIARERNLESWKGQDMASTREINARSDFKIQGRAKERLCLPLDRNLSRGLNTITNK